MDWSWLQNLLNGFQGMGGLGGLGGMMQGGAVAPTSDPAYYGDDFYQPMPANEYGPNMPQHFNPDYWSTMKPGEHGPPMPKTMQEKEEIDPMIKYLMMGGGALSGFLENRGMGPNPKAGPNVASAGGVGGGQRNAVSFNLASGSQRRKRLSDIMGGGGY